MGAFTRVCLLALFFLPATMTAPVHARFGRAPEHGFLRTDAGAEPTAMSNMVTKGSPGVYFPVIPECFRGVHILFIVLAVGLFIFSIGNAVAPNLPRGPMLSLVLCAVYVAGSVFQDVFLRWLIVGSHSEGDPAFNPFVMVFAVEFTKFLLSTALFITSQSRAREVGNADSTQGLSDLKFLALPAIFFTLYNYLYVVAIAGNEPGVFGVFRDSVILWTAVGWKLIFGAPLGHRRIVAILVIVAGLFLKLRTGSDSKQFDWRFLWLLAMTLFNSLGSLSNEFALKRVPTVDINLQNMVLYSLCMLSCLMLVGVTKPAMFASFTTFFQGFEVYVWVNVGLQAYCGLIMSRLLKYSDSVMAAVAACMRGPIFAVVAPLVLHSTFYASVIPCAAIVSAGSLGYMFEGPLVSNFAKAPTRKG